MGGVFHYWKACEIRRKRCGLNLWKQVFLFRSDVKGNLILKEVGCFLLHLFWIVVQLHYKGNGVCE